LFRILFRNRWWNDRIRLRRRVGFDASTCCCRVDGVGSGACLRIWIFLRRRSIVVVVGNGCDGVDGAVIRNAVCGFNNSSAGVGIFVRRGVDDVGCVGAGIRRLRRVVVVDSVDAVRILGRWCEFRNSEDDGSYLWVRLWV